MAGQCLSITGALPLYQKWRIKHEEEKMKFLLATDDSVQVEHATRFLQRFDNLVPLHLAKIYHVRNTAMLAKPIFGLVVIQMDC